MHEMSGVKLEINESTYEKIGNAIHETFSSILGIELKVESISRDPARIPPRHISGMVALREVDTQGILSLGFPNETALVIFSNFYGEKIEHVDQRVLEGVGEITNMVYGSLKSRLNSEGFDFQMFIPTVVVGGDFEHLKDMNCKSCVTIHYSSPQGSLWVELSLKPKQKKSKGRRPSAA
jgi:CheY-specific phosphatase CheX